MTIRTKPATAEYREGWERVFGKRSREVKLGPGYLHDAVPAKDPPICNGKPGKEAACRCGRAIYWTGEKWEHR